MQRTTAGPILALVILVAYGSADAGEGYRTPPEPLGSIVDAAPTPAVRLSPDGTRMLLMERPNLISIATLAEPELRVAGLRMNPRTSGPSRSRPYHRLSLRAVADGAERAVVGLPARPRIRNASWSPDSRHVAFTINLDERIEPWVADAATGVARRLADLRLNAVAGSPIGWIDSKTLVCRVRPGDLGGAPVRPASPDGPVIRENLEGAAPARTYQDMLEDAHDEALFEHHMTAQLVRVGLDGRIAALGSPEMLLGASPSPDGRFILVQSLERPFSSLVPYYRFPRRIEIRDRDGATVKTIAELPLQERVPTQFGSAPVGPRSVGWRDDVPATVAWAEARDGGDPRREAEIRDELFMLAAPFDREPTSLATLALRFGGVAWGSGDVALVEEWWWKSRTQRTWRVRPAQPQAEPQLVFDLQWEDRYADPGAPLRATNRWGRRALFLTDGGATLWLSGDGASEEGDRPFLDRLDLRTLETERIWRSAAPHYERVLMPLDRGGTRFLTIRESKTEPPNYHVRDVTEQGERALRRATDFPDPTPQLRGLTKELVRYTRADGVELNATLYLPPDYEKERDGALPVLVWAYPQEYKSADAAGQVKDSPHRFDRVGWWSPLLYLTLGYAVLDDPTMPIIGEGEAEPNDTYVEQLVSSAAAAVDELARRGVGDPQRVAIGGHSYGAFMAANLLAHSDLFRAGIARSGAYNRTLTPFGFQAEERTVWEAPDIYVAMSPFMHAANVDEPLLLIHGDADNNSGTYPMQSERFYNALKGLGATARLVMLPHESHGYRARESVMHMLWEQAEWLDRYVKQAERRVTPGSSSASF